MLGLISPYLSFQWFTDKVFNKCNADKLRYQARKLGIRQQSFDFVDDDDEIFLDWEDEEEDPDDASYHIPNLSTPFFH